MKNINSEPLDPLDDERDLVRTLYEVMKSQMAAEGVDIASLSAPQILQFIRPWIERVSELVRTDKHGLSGD